MAHRNQSGAGARIVRRSADTGSLLKEAARALLGRPLPLIDRHYTRRRTLLGPDPLVNSSIRRSAMPLACSMKCRARGRARHTGLTPLPEARRSAPLSGSRRRDHPADALVAAPRSGVPRSEEVRFAMDSPLEGDGFEPSVPPCLARRRSDFRGFAKLGDLTGGVRGRRATSSQLHLRA
jgi:hypothetical protein